MRHGPQAEARVAAAHAESDDPPSAVTEALRRALDIVGSLPKQHQDALRVTVNPSGSLHFQVVRSAGLSDEAARGVVHVIATTAGCVTPTDVQVPGGVLYGNYGRHALFDSVQVFAQMSPRYYADWLDRQRVTA